VTHKSRAEADAQIAGRVAQECEAVEEEVWLLDHEDQEQKSSGMTAVSGGSAA